MIVYLRKLSVPGFTLPGMEQRAGGAWWVDTLDDMAVHVTDTMLREGAGVQPPTVHVLLDDHDEQPYVGYLRCRPFYRGRDAHAAVAAMGLFASQLRATRLLVTYEHADMARGWENPGADDAPTGVVVVDADHDPRAGHTVRWHPMVMTLAPDTTPRGAAGVLPAVAQWGPPARYPGGELPAAVAQLLAVWREPHAWSHGEFVDTYRRWEQGGYAVRWAPRPGHERQQPSWASLLGEQLSGPLTSGKFRRG